MWVVFRVQKFEVEQKGPFLIKIDSRPQIGYLPVYETREDALSKFPDGPFLEIEESTASGAIPVWNTRNSMRPLRKQEEKP